MQTTANIPTHKNKALELWYKFIEALPYLVFFVGLFFVIYHFFGVADALLGIIFLFFSRTIIEEPGLSFVNYARRLGWFIVMALCATLAGLQEFLFVGVTFFYLFLITLTQSDDYLPRNFYWLGMGYLLLLIYPVSIPEIPTRLLATLLSIACTTLFIYSMRAILTKTGKLNVFARDREYVRKAFEDISKQLVVLAELGAVSVAEVQKTEGFTEVADARFTHIADADCVADLPDPSVLQRKIRPKQTYRIAQEYAQLEYGTVFRQRGLLSGRQCYTFALLLCCEQLADMIHATSKDPHAITPEDQQYFTDLADIFADYATGRITKVSQMAATLETFIESHSFADTCHRESWNGVLEALLRTLRDTRLSRDESTPFIKSVKYRIMFLRDNVNLQNTQTRFALQLATIVSLAALVDVLLTHLVDMPYGIWIPIVAFTILNTYNDETLKSTANNAIGTLVGIALFALFVHFIPSSFLMPVVITVGYLIIVMNIAPIASITAGTQMALTALYSADAALSTTLFARLALVIIAAMCVVMVIFVFMQTQRSATLRTKISELERIDRRLITQIHFGLKHGQVNLWRTVQLLYYMHMSSGFMEDLAEHLDTKEAKWESRPGRSKSVEQIKRLKHDVDRVLALNYKFAMDAEHAVMLLDPRRLHDDSLSDPHPETWVTPDSTARIKHIDATNERLEEKLHKLETMQHIEKDD